MHANISGKFRVSNTEEEMSTVLCATVYGSANYRAWTRNKKHCITKCSNCNNFIISRNFTILHIFGFSNQFPDNDITKYLLLISCFFKGNAKKFVFFSYNMNKVIGNSHAGLMHFYTKGRLLVQLITGSLHFFLGFFR